MESNKKVLIIGLTPELVDFTKLPGMSAEKVRAGLAADTAKLNALGYDAQSIFVDLGETAESVLTSLFEAKPFGCVCIGAGLRTVPSNFALFEKLLNLVHSRAPQAKICFNTNPMDTAEAVQRWV